MNVSRLLNFARNESHSAAETAETYTGLWQPQQDYKAESRSPFILRDELMNALYCHVELQPIVIHVKLVVIHVKLQPKYHFAGFHAANE